MEHTKLALTTWFVAIFWMTQSKSGIGALPLMRRLGVSYPTAWLIGHKQLVANFALFDNQEANDNVQPDLEVLPAAISNMSVAIIGLPLTAGPGAALNGNVVCTNIAATTAASNPTCAFAASTPTGQQLRPTAPVSTARAARPRASLREAPAPVRSP